MPTSVIIADDHCAIRSVLRLLVDDEPDMCVVAEAEDGDVALRLVHEHRPDVLLADISMPGPSGIQLAASLRETLPCTRVLIVTMHEDFDLVMDAMTAGAGGYLVKQRLDGHVTKAIRAIASGGTYFPRDLASRPAPQANVIGAILPDQLTASDRELLRQIATRLDARPDCSGAWCKPRSGRGPAGRVIEQAGASQPRRANSLRSRSRLSPVKLLSGVWSSPRYLGVEPCHYVNLHNLIDAHASPALPSPGCRPAAPRTQPSPHSRTFLPRSCPISRSTCRAAAID